MSLRVIILFVVLGGAQNVSAVDFDTEIISLLTRSGCNAGACHGAAAGRGGFHLSLFGSDPAADHEVLVRELEGRRINRVRPHKSLMFAKPTGDLDHEGGVVLDPEGAGAKRLLDWITEGAQRNSGRHLVRLDVEPTDTLVEKLGSQVNLRAMAYFDDGYEVDVTPWTVWTASDPASTPIDEERSYATVQRRGQHLILARYLNQVVPIRISMPLTDMRVGQSGEARLNFIDEEILETLSRLRIPVSSVADDATFVRRVSLDLVGRLPRRDEAEHFVADPDVSKRTCLVDQLLSSDDFIEFWTYRFAKLLRITPQPNDKVSAQVYNRWVGEQLRRATPIDQIARALLTAVGDSHRIGPANFSRTVADARAHAELVSQVFLGTRLQCANCHNHPFDHWTQDDYHGLAAVFARLERGQIVTVAGRGAVTSPRTGEPAIPRIPGVGNLDPHLDERIAFSEWLVAPENPYFARAFVDRLWRGMFGRGLIEPADDLRNTNPPTHSRLLDRLARDFVTHGFDLRHTLRVIALSATYMRTANSTPGNTHDDRFYSHAYRRPLEPEVLADAIADVTEVYDQYGDEPLGTRAVTLVDPKTPSVSLDILGRCMRKEACEPGLAAAGLATKLHQLNGTLINRKVSADTGALHHWIDGCNAPASVVAEFYWRALSRSPTSSESEHWMSQYDARDSSRRVEYLEDLVWGLLNCSEFNSNH